MLGFTYDNDPASYSFDRIITQIYGDDDQVFQMQYEPLNDNLIAQTVNTPRRRSTMIDRNGNRIEYELSLNGLLLSEKRWSNRDVNPDDADFFLTQHDYNQQG